jgi:hypothetical protein
MTAFFAYHKIRIPFECEKPVRGWNVKGKWASCLMKNWAGVAVKLDWHHTIPCVANVRRIFQVLFTFKFKSEKQKEERAWFLNNVEAVIAEFKQIFNGFRTFNYVHEVQYEAKQLLQKHGTLWPFANDVEETLNYLAKATYEEHSARGGLGNKGNFVVSLCMVTKFYCRALV